MKGLHFLRRLPVLIILPVLILVGCPNVEDVTPPEQSGVPTAEVTTVAKTAAEQKSVNFTLTSAHTGEWKVYSTVAASLQTPGITAAFNPETKILSLSHTVDIPAATYYVTVTEEDKTESDRLALTVGTYVAPDQSGTPTAEVTTTVKTVAVQTSVSFELTSANTGVWKVYSEAAGETAAEGVTAAFTAPNLVLSHSTDIPAATYYITVTEEGKIESSRLALTVGPYVAPGQSGTPTAAVTTVAKTTVAQASVVFELTSANNGDWKVYGEAVGETAAEGVTAVFTAPNLVLSHSTDIPATAYYVTVTEEGKTESNRLALTVTEYILSKSGTPTANSENTTVVKDTSTQKAVSFTLSSTNSGDWKVYADEIVENALTTVTAVFNTSTLTLTSTGEDLPAAAYYVTVTETGKTESDRLMLTVVSANGLHESVTLLVEQVDGEDIITAKSNNGDNYTVAAADDKIVSIATVNNFKVINFDTKASAANVQDGSRLDLINTPIHKYLPLENWTMEMYVKQAANTGNTVRFISFWGDGGNGSAPSLWVEHPSWNILTRPNESNRINAGTGTAGVWRHVALVQTGSTLTIYVNGQQHDASSGYGAVHNDQFNVDDITTAFIGNSNTDNFQMYKFTIHNTAVTDFTGVQETVNALNTVNITFNPNGGNWEGSAETKTVSGAAGSTVLSIAPENPVLADQFFAGWFTEASGGVKVAPDTLITGEAAYYAQYLANIAISFDTNGGRWNDGSITDSFELPGDTQSIGGDMPADPKRGGYKFLGWNTNADGTGTSYTADTPLAGAVDLKAVWEQYKEAVTSVTYAVEDGKFVGNVITTGGLYDGKVNAGGVVPVPSTLNGLDIIKWGNNTTNILNLDSIFSAPVGRSDFSIEFYVYIGSDGGKFDPFEMYKDTKNQNGTIRFEKAANTRRLLLRVTDTGADTTVLDANPVSAVNGWRHILLSCKDYTNWEFYVDGVQIKTGNNRTTDTDPFRDIATVNITSNRDHWAYHKISVANQAASTIPNGDAVELSNKAEITAILTTLNTVP